MSEHKTWGSTVLGWFIVRDEGDAEPAVPASQPEGAGPDTAAAPLPDVFQSTPPPASGGQVDFDGVFNAAGLDHEARNRVGKAGELLSSLPADTSVAVRKQIVEASLRAFGVPIEQIIETGVAEIQALEGYIRSGAADARKLRDESAQRIQQYENEIKNIRTVLDQRDAEQQAVAAACNSKKLEVQHVLEFFGQEAVARVVRDSPKLLDPAAHQATPTTER